MCNLHSFPPNQFSLKFLTRTLRASPSSEIPVILVLGDEFHYQHVKVMKTEKFRDTFTVPCTPLRIHLFWLLTTLRFHWREGETEGTDLTGRSGWRMASVFSLSKEAGCQREVSSQGPSSLWVSEDGSPLCSVAVLITLICSLSLPLWHPERSVVC